MATKSRPMRAPATLAEAEKNWCADAVVIAEAQSDGRKSGWTITGVLVHRALLHDRKAQRLRRRAHSGRVDGRNHKRVEPRLELLCGRDAALEATSLVPLWPAKVSVPAVAVRLQAGLRRFFSVCAPHGHAQSRATAHKTGRWAATNRRHRRRRDRTHASGGADGRARRSRIDEHRNSGSPCTLETNRRDTHLPRDAQARRQRQAQVSPPDLESPNIKCRFAYRPARSVPFGAALSPKRAATFLRVALGEDGFVAGV